MTGCVKEIMGNGITVAGYADEEGLKVCRDAEVREAV